MGVYGKKVSHQGRVGQTVDYRPLMVRSKF